MLTTLRVVERLVERLGRGEEPRQPSDPRRMARLDGVDGKRPGQVAGDLISGACPL